jgi:uncharacterized protein YodC (DUF2158 family)
MDLKIGDVVQLKSGGPLMTIEDIGKYNYSDKDKAKCIWFDGKKRYEDVFDFETLEKAD